MKFQPREMVPSGLAVSHDGSLGSNFTLTGDLIGSKLSYV